MEHHRCYNPKCGQKAELQCNCTPSGTFMCKIHVSDHALIKRGIHNIQSISIIDPEMEEFALTLLYEEISKISQLKAESINIFNQLFLSLESLLRKLCRVLDLNLNSVEQKIIKIKETKDFSKFETDQLLRSLLSKDIVETEKMCLVDKQLFANIEASNSYANEIHEMIKKLNIDNLEDITRNNFKEFTNQFWKENLKGENSQNKLTCELKKWEHTIMSWNQDFKKFPQTKENWYFKLGLIEFLTGRVYNALALFNFAIKLNPNYSDCYFYKGLALSSLNRKEESLECWNYLLQENKNFSFINIIKARVLYNLKRKTESIEVYDRFIQNSPEHFFANHLKGDALYDEKRYKEMNACCDEMIKLNPKFSPAYSEKGWAFSGLIEYAEALEWFKKAIDKDENCYNAYDGIGYTLNKQGKYEESLDYCNIAISINPYRAWIYNNKGCSLFSLKRNEEALGCFNEAIRLDPNLSSSYNEIGNILYLKEAYEEAIKYYDMAIKIDPEVEIFQNNKNEAILNLRKRR